MQEAAETGGPHRWENVMSYVRSTLAPDEKLLVIGHFPWIYDAVSLIWLMSLVGLPVFLFRAAKKAATELAVTNKRFVYKRGFISRRTDEFTTNRIHHVRVTQSWLGRLLNYGNIHIEGDEIGRFGLPAIARPLAFRRALIMSGGGSAT
jgi:uncharacterized membrane protein YdbT with pleckstrin-like domain